MLFRSPDMPVRLCRSTQTRSIRVNAYIGTLPLLGGCPPTMGMSELMAIIHKYTESDPTKDDSGEDYDGKASKGENGKNSSRSATKRKNDGGSELVAATSNGRGLKSPQGNLPRKKWSAQDILSQPSLLKIRRSAMIQFRRGRAPKRRSASSATVYAMEKKSH